MIAQMMTPTCWIAASVSKPCCLSPLPLWPDHTSSNNGNLLQVFFLLLALQEKQAIDESGVMHRLTGTDSMQPAVTMCRQDRISTLAARRHIYLALTLSHNSTALKLPRLRGANGTTPNHYQHRYTVYLLHCLTGPHFTGQCFVI